MYITLINVKEGKEYPIEGITYQYLYSVFFLLEYEFDLYLEVNKPVSFSGRMLDLLYDRLKEQMHVLINTLYKEPSNKTMSKHPGWFIKFEFDGRKFTVDYTTYAPGKLMYTLNGRLDFINSIRLSGGELIAVAKK